MTPTCFLLHFTKFPYFHRLRYRLLALVLVPLLILISIEIYQSQDWMGAERSECST